VPQAERAIERATPDEIAAGEAALRQLRSNAGNVAAWLSADTLFHSTLVRASQNPYLSSNFESVHATLINYEYQAWIEMGTVPPGCKNPRRRRSTRFMNRSSMRFARAIRSWWCKRCCVTMRSWPSTSPTVTEMDP
jgi:DNA-binding FadR family transcriptional regulator